MVLVIQLSFKSARAQTSLPQNGKGHKICTRVKDDPPTHQSTQVCVTHTATLCSPRENSSSGSCVETSCETAMCGIVCVAASRGGVGMGSGGGGGALKGMQRSKNSAKESCVAASASVADIESHVTMRVGSV